MRRCAACGNPVEAGYGFCPACGSRQGVLPAKLAPPSGRESPWLAPGLAALAGILVLIAVAAYYTGPPPVAPPANLTVDLAQPTFVGAVATISVGYASPPANPAAFFVSLRVNGTPGTATPMPSTSGLGMGPVVSPAGHPFRIDWTDVDLDSALSTGDTFTITPLESPAPCCMYLSFTLLDRADGSVVASVYFMGPPAPAVIPVVSLGTPIRGLPTNVYITVNYVDPSTPPSYLRFQLVVGSVASPIIPLPYPNLAANVSFNGSEYLVAWYDLNYDYLLDAGDSFNVSLIGGSWPAAGTAMGFYLEWQDGTTIAHATWTA